MINRRQWLGAAVAGWGLSVSASADAPWALDREVEAIEAVAQACKVGPIRHEASRHYLAIGDASLEFLRECLAVAEAIRLEYMAHFRRKGFAITEPDGLFTIVALRDADSFAAMHQSQPPAGRVARFSIASNRVIVQDLPRRGSAPGYDNASYLAHECMHQLTFNTSILDRDASTPSAVVEGLAMYGATFRAPYWRIGRINRPPLDDLVRKLHRGQPWVPLRQLIGDPSMFDDTALEPGVATVASDRRGQAYSQSWLLVHYLMTDRVMLTRFRAYLDAVRHAPRPEADRPGPAPMAELAAKLLVRHGLLDEPNARSERNVSLAAKYLGSLERLDRSLQHHMRALPWAMS